MNSETTESTPTRTSANSDAISTFSKEELIVRHMGNAERFARSFCTRWNIRLCWEDVRGMSHLALCEAASRYRPELGVEFTTYLFYFVKGALIKTVISSKAVSEHECAMSITADDGHEYDRPSNNTDKDPEEPHDPEVLTYRNELKSMCKKALGTLSELEREVVVRVHMMDGKVARVARDLGYSRGHLSAVRTSAFRKIRPYFDEFKHAA